MAEAKKDDKKDDKAAAAASTAAASAKKKKKLLAIGGGLGLLALAFVAALMAVPKKQVKPDIAGPFVAPLTPSKVQVNLSDGRTYLVMQLKVLYEAYAEAYLTARTQNPVCQAELRDALVAIASAKSRNDVADKVNKPVFLEEIRHAVEPLLFPVQLGDNQLPTDPDSESGLAPGASMSSATFRGLYEEHALLVDPIGKTVQLDDGPAVRFVGGERDLELKDGQDATLYVDVTGLKSDFSGHVRVGVKGRTRRMLFDEFLIQ